MCASTFVGFSPGGDGADGPALRVVRGDPKDDPIIAAAVAAKADFLVTGDRAHLLRDWRIPGNSSSQPAGIPRNPRLSDGAGEGNRTLVVSLGSFCSTIELHPRGVDDRRKRRVEGRRWMTRSAPLCRGSAFRIEGRAGGPLSGLTFAAKDLFDVAGHPTGGGNPDWARAHPVPARHAWAVQTLLDAGATLIGKTDHRRGLARHPRRKPVRRHAGQPARAGPCAGRIVVGLGGGGRGRAVRHRARHRYRRLGAGAGELLRALRHPPDAWPARPHRHDEPGADLRHDRLVRPRRRHLRARLGGHARRGDPAGAAGRLLVAADAFALRRPRRRRGAAAARRPARRADRRRAARRCMAPPGLAAWARAQRTLQPYEAWQTFQEWIDRANPRFQFSVARNLVLGAHVPAGRARYARAGARGGARPDAPALAAGHDPLPADDAVSGAATAASRSRSSSRCATASPRCAPWRADRRAAGHDPRRDGRRPPDRAVDPRRARRRRDCWSRWRRRLARDG